MEPISLLFLVVAGWAVSKIKKSSAEATSPEPAQSPIPSPDPAPSADIASSTGVFTLRDSPYKDLIAASAVENGISPEILDNLIYTESRYRIDALSPVGAMGIAQFMPETAKQVLGSEEAAYNPELAIPGAAKYLATIRDYVGKGDIGMIAGYNWGMGNAKKYALSTAPKETKDYVFHILGVNL